MGNAHDAMYGAALPVARLEGAMTGLKRMMDMQMCLASGAAPGTGIARVADVRQDFFVVLAVIG